MFPTIRSLSTLPEIHLRRPTARLAKAVAAGELPRGGDVVRSYIREWRPGCDESENYWHLTACI